MIQDTSEFEIVCVDDDSRDGSLTVLRQLQIEPKFHLRIIKLTRNFGSMSAIQAGLHTARGAVIGIITADEQDPADLFETMHEHWRRGAKCVYAVRANREEGFLKKNMANAFYALLNRFALPKWQR